MQFFRHRLQAFLRVALFAMLGLALAPSIARAMNPAAGATLEVCTGAGPGVQFAQTAGAAQPDTPASTVRGAHLEHCPLCGQPGAGLGLLAAEPALPTPALGALAPTAGQARSPRPSGARSSVQARAPPLG